MAVGSLARPVRCLARFLVAPAVLALLGAAPAAAHYSGENGRWDLTAKLVQQAQAGPPPQPVPRADCGPGSKPEPGMQGRVPRGADPGGYTCNTTLLGQEGGAGGYKVLRFVDKAGRECAYYDTTLLFPTNAQNLSEDPTGVAVLDMSDPSRPVRTATLLTPAMQTPHESLVLNERRGLLAAVMGNPIVYPGHVDIYDLNEDCRHPELQSSLPVGVLGHESGFAPDGNTFYATSIGTGHVTAVDVSNPRLPRPIWEGEYKSHGLTVSDDGNRAYLAASGGLIILDTSEVQARKLNPQVRVVSRLNWSTMTIPQVAHPVTIDGKPYLVEIDEFSGDPDGENVVSNGSRVGAARIIDISDETAPRVVSDIRLEVHQPENRVNLGDDPGASSSLQGYAGHYCNIPRRREPGIVACSFIASGLRVFDIRDPERPRELAYFTTPLTRSSTAGDPSNYAMSSPEFVPARGEIWYSDGNTGFYSVRVAERVWPFAEGAGCRDRRPPITRLRRRGVRVSGDELRLRGTSRDRRACRSGVDRVQVSLARVRGRTGVNCRFVKRRDAYRLTRPRNCRRPVLFTARGGRSWRFRFPFELAPGRYRVQARGTDNARNKETPKKGRNIVFLTVR